MKKLTLLLCGAASVFSVTAQNVGIGTSTPHSSAKLELSATNMGFLPPRLTSAQRDAIEAPAMGLTIYNSSNQGLETFSGSVWKASSAARPPAFFLATDQSVGNLSFIGTGTSSSGFDRNSVVIPVDCELSSITFSIRTPAVNTNITATVWRKTGTSPAVATSLTATIADGFASFSAFGTGSVMVQRGDLVGVQFNWSTGGALANGATVAITYK